MRIKAECPFCFEDCTENLGDESRVRLLKCLNCSEYFVVKVQITVEYGTVEFLSKKEAKR